MKDHGYVRKQEYYLQKIINFLIKEFIDVGGGIGMVTSML